MDTEYCGLPRGGIESFDDSHGSIFGCWRKSVNQEQPVSDGGENDQRRGGRGAR